MGIAYTKLFESVNDNLSRIPSLSAFGVAATFTAVWGFIKLVRMTRSRVRTTTLRGPPNSSFLFGADRMLMHSNNPASNYESWASQYGSVYAVPTTLGMSKIVLFDPKALSHFYAKESRTYARTPLVKRLLERTIGKGLFLANAESHKRQRKSLMPAFSIAAIRNLTPVFYDSARKAKVAWNEIIESNGGDSAIIDVLSWMNNISLDIIGIAGFSHDFGAVDGKQTTVAAALRAFSSLSSISAVHIALGLLSQVFPFLLDVPTKRMRLGRKLDSALNEVSNRLLTRMKGEMEKGVVAERDKSMIGLLTKVERDKSKSHLSNGEVLAQIKTLIFAGYETTSISLTWALIELSRNPNVQTKLRNEILVHGSDASYDQLQNDLLYLDAVVHEILRLHAPILETTRIALDDDILPLSKPVRTPSGGLIESVTVAKGAVVSVPIAAVNRATSFWGEDAKVFRPNRWLVDEDREDDIPAQAKELQGHRHLLTFSDGSRICLGKNFAIAVFKAVLYVLVKHFVFELRDGPGTKIEMTRGFLPRPRVLDEVGCKVPLRVKPFMD